MLRQKLSLLRAADAGLPCTVLIVGALIMGLLAIGGRHPGAGFWVAFVGLLCASGVCLWRRAEQRYRRLHEGHCPYPMCSGSVQHSPRAHRGLVVCPTCGREWPDIRGIHFLVTHHD
jgi:hypothetical protein